MWVKGAWEIRGWPQIEVAQPIGEGGGAARNPPARAAQATPSSGDQEIATLRIRSNFILSLIRSR
jgi:hypothetical protein